jgi:hypothetical protein
MRAEASNLRPLKGITGIPKSFQILLARSVALGSFSIYDLPEDSDRPTVNFYFKWLL